MRAIFLVVLILAWGTPAQADSFDTILNCALKGRYHANSKGELKKEPYEKTTANPMIATIASLGSGRPKIKCNFSVNCSVETDFVITKRKRGLIVLADQDTSFPDSSIFVLNYSNTKDITFYFYKLMNPSGHTEDFPIYGDFTYGSCN